MIPSYNPYELTSYSKKLYLELSIRFVETFDSSRTHNIASARASDSLHPPRNSSIRFQEASDSSAHGIEYNDSNVHRIESNDCSAHPTISRISSIQPSIILNNFTGNPESSNLLVRIGSKASRLTVGSRIQSTSSTPVTTAPRHLCVG